MVTSPAPPQVVVVEPHTIYLAGRPLRNDITYAISSLEPEQASAARSGRLLRGHWEIENRLHWVRDVTSGEDHSQIRIGVGWGHICRCANELSAGSWLVRRSRRSRWGMRISTAAPYLFGRTAIDCWHADVAPAHRQPQHWPS
jgi:hypothetical protein